MIAVCENCASDDDDLTPVWPATDTGEQPELWCPECRSRFPHEAATDGEEAGEDEGEGDEAG
ncbi:MAG: hypothetical protein ACJ768_15035 [Gaiellaceae bacterium]